VDRHVDREADVQRLLDTLCVEVGFCLPPVEQRHLRASWSLDAGAFTDAVFDADGMDPRLDPVLYRQVRSRVDQHMSRWAS
jgi:hypothetical protein